MASSLLGQAHRTTMSALLSSNDEDGTNDGTAATPTEATKTHRILCYGDSLTAGTSISPLEMFPYALHLERSLNDNARNNQKYVVRHRGLPGWTASAMEDAKDDRQYGLRAAIQGIQDPVLSCVVILAGTNDLGYALAGNSEDPVQTVLQPIQQLHRIAFAAGVQTIAVAIPGSGYQAKVAEASLLALEVNQALDDFCVKHKSTEGKATFVPFPFEFEFDTGDDASTNWSPDGLHCSPLGYQRLGEALSDPVLRVLSKTR